MKKVTIQSFVFAVLALTGCFALKAAEAGTNSSSGADRISELFEDSVIAQGKNVKVTRTALDDAMVYTLAAAQERGRPIQPKDRKAVEAQLLEQLIDSQLLNQRATEADKTAGAEKAKKALDAFLERAGGNDGLALRLKVTGLTLEKFKSKLNTDSVAEAVLDREIKFEVSDDDVKKYYDENPTQFEAPEQVRVAHILIATREKDGSEMTDAKKKEQRKLVEDLLKRAKGGEDFSKLAREYSDNPGAKENGGEVGPFPRGTRQVPPEFEAAAFSTDANKISDVITTQFGYHIIKTLEKTPAKKYELAEVSADVKTGLKQLGKRKQIPAYIEGIKKEAGVEVLNKDIKKVMDDLRAAEAEMEKAAEAKKPLR